MISERMTARRNSAAFHLVVGFVAGTCFFCFDTEAAKVGDGAGEPAESWGKTEEDSTFCWGVATGLSGAVADDGLF